MKKRWFALGVALVVIGGGIYGITEWRHQSANPSAVSALAGLDNGKPLIPFSSTTSLNQALISTSQYAGKPMFINFWASWCPPCQAETPDLVKAYQQYGKQVQFISVNVTSNDSVKAAKAFVEKYHISYPIVLDTTGHIEKAYKLLGYPTSLFVNRSGKIIASYLGQIPQNVLDGDLKRIES